MVVRMQYIVGSFIISFGILFLPALFLLSLDLRPPAIVLEYLLLVWVLLAAVTYPFARKIIRD